MRQLIRPVQSLDHWPLDAVHPNWAHPAMGYSPRLMLMPAASGINLLTGVLGQLNGGIRVGVGDGDATLGQVLAMDGSDDFLDFGTAGMHVTRYTIFFRARVDTYTDFRGMLDTTNGANGICIFEDDSAGAGFYITHNGFVTGLAAGYTPTNGEIVNLCVTFNGTAWTWWRNGVASNTTTSGAVDPGASIGSLRVGVQRAGSTDNFDGNLDFLVMFGAAMPGTLIQRIQTRPYDLVAILQRPGGRRSVTAGGGGTFTKITGERFALAGPGGLAG